MDPITTGQLSQAQIEFVQKTVMLGLEDLTRDAMFKYAEKVNYEPTSDTYTWRKYALNSKTSSHIIEGVTPDGIDYGLTDYAVKVYQEGNFIPLTDKQLKYGIDKQLAISGELLGEDAKDRMASILNDLAFSGANVRYAQGQASTAAVLSNTKGITVADLNKIKADFQRRKVKPVEGKKYLFFASPEVIADFKNISDVNASWVDIEKYANPNEIVDGEVGTAFGFRFIEYLGCPVKSSNVHCCLAMGKEGLGVVAIDGEDAKGGFQVIYHAPGESGSVDPLNQRGSIGWKHDGFAGRILRDEAICRYECYHSESVASDITDSNRSHYVSASGLITPSITETSCSVDVTGNWAKGNLLKLTATAASGKTFSGWTLTAGVTLIQGALTDATIYVLVNKDASAITIVAAAA